MGHGIPLKANNSSRPDSKLTKLFSWRSADYAVFSSKYCEEHFQQYIDSGIRAGFIDTGLTEGTSIYTGYPKTDAIINNSIGTIDSIDTDRDQLDIDQSDVVIGYFPTRRVGHGIDLDTIFDVSQTEEFLQQNDAKLLSKPHRRLGIAEGITESNLVQLINSDSDSHQFLTEIDILITDYSSIYFDFLLLDRPIIFYTPDYGTYVEIRGVHPNYENVIAGPRVNEFEELLEQLESHMNGVDEYSERRQEIRDRFFEYADGNASKRILEKVID
jgi:CDP-glycerol glycerophosphotransferase (TagB/SpsB family)